MSGCSKRYNGLFRDSKLKTATLFHSEEVSNAYFKLKLMDYFAWKLQFNTWIHVFIDNKY